MVVIVSYLLQLFFVRSLRRLVIDRQGRRGEMDPNLGECLDVVASPFEIRLPFRLAQDDLGSDLPQAEHFDGQTRIDIRPDVRPQRFHVELAALAEPWDGCSALLDRLDPGRQAVSNALGQLGAHRAWLQTKPHRDILLISDSRRVGDYTRITVDCHRPHCSQCPIISARRSLMISRASATIRSITSPAGKIESIKPASWPKRSGVCWASPAARAWATAWAIV